MAASSRLMITTEAERRFAVRVKVAVPRMRLGDRLNRMHAWLDDNCGADGREITPTGMRGLVNDAIAVHFKDATLAGAFAARWCAPVASTSTEGFLCIRSDEPADSDDIGRAFRLKPATCSD